MNGLKSVAIGLLATLATSSSVWADNKDLNYGPHMWGYGWHGGFMGPFLMIVFLVVLIVAVVLVVRWLGGSVQSASAPPGKTPLDILKERFARGEIDKTEFEERRSVLET